ncbi:4431_t:CDS:2, partial [Acaulospora colombiana]
DLRRDRKTIEELQKTNQRPVTPEEPNTSPREWLSVKRLELVTTSNALHGLAKVSVRSSSTPPVPPSSPAAKARRRNVFFSRTLGHITPNVPEVSFFQ